MALNKIKYGLKNVHVALLTKGDDGTFTYETPVAIPGAVSLSMDAEGEMNPFYADNIVYFRTVSNNGYTGDLEMALIPDWFRERVLQEVKDSKGVLVETANITDVQYFALLFQFEGDKKAIRHVLYNCTANRPTVESQTKEDNIEPGTETLSLTADPREDGLVKARSGDDTNEDTYKNWFTRVYVPTISTDGQIVTG
ncbi:MAG: phage tail protein [Selenomonadaceae bacterium]|nr:phage tail protein [Selenomonadaceae bacterium]